jgi:hypothetical protein
VFFAFFCYIAANFFIADHWHTLDQDSFLTAQKNFSRRKLFIKTALSPNTLLDFPQKSNASESVQRLKQQICN